MNSRLYGILAAMLGVTGVLYAVGTFVSAPTVFEATAKAKECFVFKPNNLVEVKPNCFTSKAQCEVGAKTRYKFHPALGQMYRACQGRFRV